MPLKWRESCSQSDSSTSSDNGSSSSSRAFGIGSSQDCICNHHPVDINININFCIAQTPTVRPRAYYIVIISFVIWSSMCCRSSCISILGLPPPYQYLHCMKCHCSYWCCYCYYKEQKWSYPKVIKDYSTRWKCDKTIVLCWIPSCGYFLLWKSGHGSEVCPLSLCHPHENSSWSSCCYVDLWKMAAVLEQLHRKQVTSYQANRRWPSTEIILVSSGWCGH